MPPSPVLVNLSFVQRLFFSSHSKVLLSPEKLERNFCCKSFALCLPRKSLKLAESCATSTFNSQLLVITWYTHPSDPIWIIQFTETSFRSENQKNHKSIRLKEIFLVLMKCHKKKLFISLSICFSVSLFGIRRAKSTAVGMPTVNFFPAAPHASCGSLSIKKFPSVRFISEARKLRNSFRWHSNWVNVCFNCIWVILTSAKGIRFEDDDDDGVKRHSFPITLRRQLNAFGHVQSRALWLRATIFRRAKHFAFWLLWIYKFTFAIFFLNEFYSKCYRRAPRLMFSVFIFGDKGEMKTEK